ncbi:ATP-dependent dethiobiotin synthetase BioD [Streptomyces montanus]|uniref:ATP-dependent dethiobiotin synthetase BioD n=1 Tax=Streptomyces montanus TaxID=2580423 RepID=A0A5R9FN02_9ACTN|nr:dethiobiotin synthase [Streptomyces montanus]TLS43989.1 ATP-dependent dethiobiotin synthetase BioD [Streptomyces montanus]
MSVLVITGTGTEVGKTVTTAAVAAAAVAAGRSVAVLKPAQTGVLPGERGDADEVAWLAGAVTAVELARYPDPLAPATAAHRAGLAPVRPYEVAEAAGKLAAEHDLVLVEGAGGLLVRFDGGGGTLADAARLLDAPLLVVVSAGLGTLNTTELTARELRARRLDLLGVVVGSWPRDPDLASRCNLADLPVVAGEPLLGALPEGVGGLRPAVFRATASDWLAPPLGGTWDADAFTAEQAAPWAADSPGHDAAGSTMDG